MNNRRNHGKGENMDTAAARAIDHGLTDILSSAPVDVDSIRCSLGLTLEEVSSVVGKSPRTVSRWRHDAADRVEIRGSSARALRKLAELQFLIEDVLGAEQVTAWLRAPNRGFRGKAPIDLMLAGDVDTVLNALERLADGGPV
jgi:uncharacterized protein (DUF2384 family)